MEKCAINGFLTPAQRARYYAQVSRRESVRTFIAPPDQEQLSTLSYAAARLCLPGVRIEILECDDKKLYGSMPFVETIMGTPCYAAFIVDTQVPHVMEHMGISGEAFMLEAVSMGLGTCWVGGTYRKKAVEVTLKPHEKLAAITPLGVPAQMENRERRRKTLRDICAVLPDNWPLWAYNAAECVRIAPSALNLQPWKLNYAGRTLQLCRKNMFASGLDMGIAMLHMSLGVGEKDHVISWGEGREVATLLAEDRI